MQVIYLGVPSVSLPFWLAKDPSVFFLYYFLFLFRSTPSFISFAFEVWGFVKTFFILFWEVFFWSKLFYALLSFFKLLLPYFLRRFEFFLSGSLQFYELIEALFLNSWFVEVLFYFTNLFYLFLSWFFSSIAFFSAKFIFFYLCDRPTSSPETIFLYSAESLGLFPEFFWSWLFFWKLEPFFA